MNRICILIIIFTFAQIRPQEDLSYQEPPEEILKVLSLNRADLLSGTHITLKSNDAAERAIAPRLFVS